MWNHKTSRYCLFFFRNHRSFQELGGSHHIWKQSNIVKRIPFNWHKHWNIFKDRILQFYNLVNSKLLFNISTPKILILIQFLMLSSVMIMHSHYKIWNLPSCTCEWVNAATPARQRGDYQGLGPFRNLSLGHNRAFGPFMGIWPGQSHRSNEGPHT